MSIFSKARSFGKSSHWSRPSAPVRETRRSKPAHPFAEGIETARTIETWAVEGHLFTLSEDDQWYTTPGGFRFTLSWVSASDVDSKGFDTEADAKCFAWHTATPLPVEEVPPSYYADETPTLEDAAFHDPSDESWWAEHSHESQADFDAWLDDLNADQMASLSDDFGGGFIGGVESW